MSSQKGRDFLLKIGNGASPEVFATLGAVRTVALTVNNQPVDTTAMDGNGLQTLQADAGVQSMEITLDGLFKDSAAEELLRLAAFNRTSLNYQVILPNGDVYATKFMVREYRRGGSFDGLETFSVALSRQGGGTFTA
jgi:TP901-1 family phage major tail protein